MLALLRLGVNLKSGPLSLRFPRDSVPEEVPPLADIPEIEYGSWEVLRQGGSVAILAVGTMVKEAVRAADTLAQEGLEVTVVNCRFLKPLDETVLEEVLKGHSRILTVEEGAVVNGFGAFLARELEVRADGREVTVRTLGIPDQFVVHGGRAELLREIDLDAQGIAEQVRKMTQEAVVSPPSQLMETA